MDPDQLKRKAEHFRQLANLISDEQMREGLLKLAAEYEAKADALARGKAEDHTESPPRGDGT